MNKYNEIMNNVTVDPEMKNRIMGAVSAAIKEQSGSAVVTDIPKDKIRNENSGNKNQVRKAEVKPAQKRKKAKKTPIAIISSIAAGVLVIAGAVFVVNYFHLGQNFRTSENTMKSVDTHSAALNTEAVDEVYEETVAGFDNTVAEETTEGATDGILSINTGSSYNYSADHVSGTDNRDAENKTIDITVSTTLPEEESDESEVMGDARLDRIARALPFDIKGSGSGVFSDSISEEVFFGVNGEKVLLCSAPEGTDDLIKQVFHQTPAEGVAATSPSGIQVTLYRVTFANVKDLTGEEVSADVNAAVFVKGGKTYLLVFSDAQPADVILGVVDAV
ncbi:MAG: hypothetical protein Q4C15_04270 [Eubacteriales bacterium]|nr:hypothetical protein [Eubacteriales bacterium]